MWKMFLLVVALLLCVFVVNAQTLLLEENFDYTAGTNLTSNGWTAHSGTGTNPITVNSGGLTYSGYSSSGIGNAALVDNTGEDVNRSFTSQTAGTIYYSFLVQVNAVANGYFIHLMNTNTTFAARVFIQTATGGFNFGVSNSSTGVFGTTVFSTGTTYLCVVKYDFSTSDVKLWVFSSGVPPTEGSAGTPEASTTGSGQASISAIGLRQYSSSQNVIVDGIRVGTSWDYAPLPVELTSFTAVTRGKNVELRWATATEVNNYGFEIEKRMKDELGSKKWEKIGFVEGSGTTNAPKEYSFSDALTANGTYVYRLKQIDRDGQFTYSPEVEVMMTQIAQTYALKQNYPNPFNPATTISFTVPSAERATLKVYDLTGREVATLFNEVANPGQTYNVLFNGKGLASGIYIYVLQTPAFREVKKMQLIK